MRMVIVRVPEHRHFEVTDTLLCDVQEGHYVDIDTARRLREHLNYLMEFVVRRPDYYPNIQGLLEETKEIAE